MDGCRETGFQENSRAPGLPANTHIRYWICTDKERSSWFLHVAEYAPYGTLRWVICIFNIHSCKNNTWNIVWLTLKPRLSIAVSIPWTGMSESTGPQTLNFISRHRWRTGSCGPRLNGVRLKIHNPDTNGEGEVITCTPVTPIDTHHMCTARSAILVAMCSWATWTMRRRQRRPLMMRGGCTLGTLEELTKTVFFGSREESKVRCSSCMLDLKLFHELVHFIWLPSLAQNWSSPLVERTFLQHTLRAWSRQSYLI